MIEFFSRYGMSMVMGRSKGGICEKDGCEEKGARNDHSWWSHVDGDEGFDFSFASCWESGVVASIVYKERRSR